MALSLNEITAKIESMAAFAAGDIGAFVYDVEVEVHGGNGAVRVFLDRQGSELPGQGVSIGDIEKVARAVSAQLDLDDIVPFNYRLEVSSPGVERTLKTERQFRQNLGRQVRLVLAAPVVGGDNVLVGLLEGVEGETALVRHESQGVIRVALSQVRRGRTVFDFGGQTPKEKSPAPSSGGKSETGKRR